MTHLHDDPMRVVAAPSPRLPPETAAAILEEFWGLRGALRPLVSERDQNFFVDAAADGRFVLKIANSAEDRQVTLFQIAALQYIERRSTGPWPALPRVIDTLDGRSHCDVEQAGASHVVRLVSWVDGRLAEHLPPGPRLARSAGECLANLGRLLKGFTHAAQDHSLLWDMKKSASLRDHLSLVKNQDEFDLVSRALDDFEELAMPKFGRLRWQVIHNDMHPDNFLVSADNPDRVVGVIDFGDMLYSPLVVDLGVACAYLRGSGSSPLDSVAAFVAGYHSVTPLDDPELSLLYYLVRARLAATICIGRWRASARDESDPYLAGSLEGADQARRFLGSVTQVSADEFRQAISPA